MNFTPLALLLSISNLSLHVLFWDDKRASEGKHRELPGLDFLKASAFVCFFKIWSTTFIKSLLCVRVAVVIKKISLSCSSEASRRDGKEMGSVSFVKMFLQKGCLIASGKEGEVSQAHVGEMGSWEYICRGLKEEGGAWARGCEWKDCSLKSRSGFYGVVLLESPDELVENGASWTHTLCFTIRSDFWGGRTRQIWWWSLPEFENCVLWELGVLKNIGKCHGQMRS